MRYFLTLILFLVSSPSFAAEPLDQIKHIIVISLENHSFDNLFGSFPGAEGLSNARATSLQTDKNGIPYKTLPPVMDTRHKPPVRDKRFPADLINLPFSIDGYMPQSDETGDLVHRFNQEQAQIHGGKMDRFAAISNAGGLTMGYFDGSKTGLWQYAQHYTLADHFFHSAFGGSFLNHFWLVCACTPRFDHAPQDEVITDSKDGNITKDGYVVNTMFSVNIPHPPLISHDKLMPQQTLPTIGDRLSAANISWAWYSGGWNDAINGKPATSFQYHHQPLAYFKNFAEGTKERTTHLKDEVDLMADLRKGTLPSVVFYKPLGEYNLHPGYATITEGDAHIMELLKTIEHSSVWKDSLVIITFDENGGYWDHVAPPVVDRWGPGVRVPTILLSRFAKKNTVDHTIYETASILKLIETRFHLEPLGTRDAQAGDLTQALALPDEE